MIDRPHGPPSPYHSTLTRVNGNWTFQLRAHESERCDHIITVTLFKNGDGSGGTAFVSWPPTALLSLNSAEVLADALQYAVMKARHLEKELTPPFPPLKGSNDE